MKNGHGATPEYLLARQRPLCWFLQNVLHVLAVFGVCSLIGNNSLRSRCEGVVYWDGVKAACVTRRPAGTRFWLQAYRDCAKSEPK